MKEETLYRIWKVREICNNIEEPFMMLFLLLLWVMGYESAFWIILLFFILGDFAFANRQSKIEKKLNVFN